MKMNFSTWRYGADGHEWEHTANVWTPLFSIDGIHLNISSWLCWRRYKHNLQKNEKIATKAKYEMRTHIKYICPCVSLWVMLTMRDVGYSRISDNDLSEHWAIQPLIGSFWANLLANSWFRYTHQWTLLFQRPLPTLVKSFNFSRVADGRSCLWIMCELSCCECLRSEGAIFSCVKFKTNDKFRYMRQHPTVRSI